MNLFERLLYRRLCNEQPADGGAAPAASEPATTIGDNPAPAGEPAQKEGETPQPGADGAKPAEDKPADGQKQEGDKPAEKKEDDKPEGAPEKYEFQAAEGVELDTEALKEFEPVAREMNLTNEQAQKLVDVYPKILAGVQQRQAEAWQQTTEQWAADVKADKEIGGDKLTSNISAAQRALDQFGTPELKEYLNTTGLGNHPDLVKTFVKIGKAMSEDGMVTGGNDGQRSAAEVLYGK
ncbi:peptidase [Salmonella enterica subsp. enterica serovar Ohio]|uniref:Peptidase n=1 Tax=Salmonella enterica subsp. enterica serovar Mbandaka TaxID=192954 RepID=A0A6Y5B0C4_SALET|nr:peptidase [Salmonella enterica]EBS6179214.1 peptidase [Salmonella enterica subsp. enterica serovar Braenderup]ECQ7735067.1 peptidase [Salmonella enterica subsp. enterica serovar Brunei]EDB2915261.1 peptidase [Salmonella enterica subsp. enterica serovar Galiema]EDI7173744.1 peptidase [Salmonella enterica subsp. enterica serovar Schwarzengrund]EED9694040.1 peptidase [Salmonella enterica subsp. enterica serovar Ohio]MBJ3042890.1 peptidase [Salmonella enterica subsp. enterica serovar Typhimuri